MFDLHGKTWPLYLSLSTQSRKCTIKELAELNEDRRSFLYDVHEETHTKSKSHENRKPTTTKSQFLKTSRQRKTVDVLNWGSLPQEAAAH